MSASGPGQEPGVRIPLGSTYRRLFASAASANLGDGLMSVAIVWLASTVTRDATVIALVALASRVPWLLFSLPAGVITDRVDRRRLVAWMDVARTVAVGALGLVVLRYQDDLPTPEELAAGAPEPASAPLLVTALCVTALLLGFAEVLRDNAAQTLMPSVVDKSLLEKANGRMWAAETTMNNVVGPPLGGLLVGVALAVPFLLNAGLLAASAVLVLSLAGSFAPRRAGAPGPEGAEGAGGANAVVRTQVAWRAEIAEGFGWLWRHRLLRTLALMLGALNMLSTLAFVNGVLFAQDVLGLYQGWQFGLVTTGFAAGAVIGALLSDRISARLSPGTSLVTSIGGMGLATTVMGLVPVAAAFWLAGLVSGVLVVLWNVITVSLRQRLIPDHLLGRVNSVYRFFGWGTMSLGTIGGGLLVSLGEPWLGREWALRAVFLLAGAAQLALVGVAWRRLSTPRIREAEARAEAEAAVVEG